MTRILDAVERGETQAAEKLLPLAYEELRRMAASKMAAERGSHTLQATALVHEAYLKLLGPEGEGRSWRGKQHFFAAAAEAMRRILIDSARKRQTDKRGGDPERSTWDEARFASELPGDEILAVDEALSKMEFQDPDLAKLVKLRYFAGLSIAETASALGVSESSVDRSWRGARAWLFREISKSREET
ncbi:ECF-type sigma factor [Verrucomicrobiaceae bacterium 227]